MGRKKRDTGCGVYRDRYAPQVCGPHIQEIAEERSASVTYGCCDGSRVVFADGEMRGTVADHPRGENSFGWGNIFVPVGSDRTYAELDHEEQEGIAMRKGALRCLKTEFSR